MVTVTVTDFNMTTERAFLYNVMMFLDQIAALKNVVVLDNILSQRRK